MREPAFSFIFFLFFCFQFHWFILISSFLSALKVKWQLGLGLFCFSSSRWEMRFEKFSLLKKMQEYLSSTLSKFILYSVISYIYFIIHKSSYFIHLITASLYPFTKHLLFSSASLSPWQPPVIVSPLCNCEFSIFSTCKYYCAILVSVWLISFSMCPPVLFMLLQSWMILYCIYLLMERHLGCLYILAITSNMNL